MWHYVLTYLDKEPSLILMSGDSNFSSLLSDFRYRCKMNIIIIYNYGAHPSYLSCGNSVYRFEDLIENLPPRLPNKHKRSDVILTNLPLELPAETLKRNLLQFTSNLGGRVLLISPGQAKMTFGNCELAKRAVQRINHRIVGGNQIQAELEISPDHTLPSTSSGRVLEEERMHINVRSRTQADSGSREEVNLDVERSSSLPRSIEPTASLAKTSQRPLGSQKAKRKKKE